MPARRVAVIGAGPIGLEASLLARLQNFEVVLLERNAVAENVQSWGHVRLFTPFGINSSTWGRAALCDTELPDDDELLTGTQFYHRYLLPLSRHQLLDGCVRENCQVVSISRQSLWKKDLIGQRSRQMSSFQLLVENPAGEEELVEADYVFDCSGTFGNHNWIGAGGMPAVGERGLADRIHYQLPDFAERDRADFSGRRILVVGSGYSAATAVVQLSELRRSSHETEVVWLTRGNRTTPLDIIDGDSLRGRAELTETANALAANSESPVEWINGALVRRLSAAGQNQIQVTISVMGEQGGSQEKTLTVDHVIANAGYRPDRTLYEELQVHECYASQGPMKLAAALLGESSSDCMAQSAPGAESLLTPEPGFFILGAKSYGRDSRFLLRTGLQQISSVFELMASETE